MFGPLGFQEVLVILGLALLIFGPRELPKIGRTIGRAMGEFRKASTELKRSLNTEMIEEELRQSDPRKVIRETAKELEAAAMAEESETVAESVDAGPAEAAPESGSSGAPADAPSVEDVSAEDVPAEDVPADDVAAEDGAANSSAPVPRDRPATGAGS